MARKGNFSFDSDDDLGFGDEMFPIDDSAFDDSGLDFLEGLDGSTAKAKSGVGGFFKNAVKSVKGLGLDIVNEFMPATIDMKDSVSFALQDVKSTLSEKKDWAAEKLGEMRSKKADVSIGNSIKNSFKATVSNIKQGKFYKSSLDMSDMDMNAFFNEDDDGEEYESEDVDTSGIMTTSYSSTRKKSARPISVVNYNTDTQGMIEATAAIQQDAVMASAKISTRIANKQTAVLEQNFAIQRAYLQNISNNLTNAVNFMFNEGSTSLKAQLEYSAKSLAFMTDQNNLLKEQIKLANRQLGIDIEKQKAEEVDEKFNPFSGGMFDMDKYFKRIGKNAKDMFSGTTLGFGYDSLKQMNDLQSSMGMKMGIGDMAKSMMKSGIMNTMFSNATKGKFDKINELVENFGFGLTAKANRMKNSDNPIKQFFGNLLGYDETISKHADMGIAGRADEPVAFTAKTDMTINTVIPGQLNKIIQLLGGEGQYFDYKQGVFRSDSSKIKQYKMAQQEVFDRDIEFSSSYEQIKTKGSDELTRLKKGRKTANAYKEITPKDVESAFKLFQDNMINKRITIGDRLFVDENNYGHIDDGKEPSVGNRNGSFDGELAALFDGFDKKFGKNSKNISEIIRMSVQTMDPATISVLNRRVLRLGDELEKISKSFKEDAMKYGGSLALANMNLNEKYEAEDFDLRTSSNYDENHVANRNNQLAKNKARVNRIQRETAKFYERGGIIDEVSENNKNASGVIKGTAVEKIDNIYKLLLNGITVFPTSPSDEQRAFLNKAAQSIRVAEIKQIRNKRQEEAKDEIMRNNMYENARQISIEKKAARYGSMDLGIFNLLPLDEMSNRIMGTILRPFAQMAGMEAELDNIVKGEEVLPEDVTRRIEEKQNARVETYKNFREKAKEMKDKGGLKGVLGGAANTIVGTAEKVKTNAEVYIAKKAEARYKRELKAREKAKRKNAPFYAKLEGIKDVYNKYTEWRNEGKNRVVVYCNKWTPELEERWRCAMDEEHMGIEFTDVLDSNVDLIMGKLTKGEEATSRKMIDFLGIKEVKSTVDFEKTSDLINSEGFLRYKINKEKLQQEYYKQTITGTPLEDKTSEAFEKAVREINGKSGDKLTKYAKKQGVSRTVFSKSGGSRTRSDAEMKNILKSKAKTVKAKNSNVNKGQMQAASISKSGILPKSLSGIKGSKAAYELFKKKGISNDIDALLASRNQDAILNFADSIMSKHDGWGPISDSQYLNPQFKYAIDTFLSDPELAGKGVRLRATVRSPLSQLALYSVGRTDPAITEALLRKAGYTKENTSWYNQIMDAAEKEKTIADTLDSKHMRGLAVDIDNGNISYKKLGAIADKYGITWGGRWSSNDVSHFELGTAGGKATIGPMQKPGTTKGIVGPFKPMTKQSMGKADIIDYFKADAPTESSADSKNAENIKLSDNLKESEYGKAFKGNKPLFLIHNRLLEIRDTMNNLTINTGLIGNSLGIPGLLKKAGVFALDTVKGTFKFLKDRTKNLTGMARAVGEKAKEGINKVRKWAEDSDIVGSLKSKATGLKASILGTGVSLNKIAKMKKEELIEFAVSKLGMKEEDAKAMKVSDLRKLCIDKAKNNLLGKGKDLLGSITKGAGSLLSTGKELAEKGLGFATDKAGELAKWGGEKANQFASYLSEKITGGKNLFAKGSDSVKAFLEDKKTTVTDIKERVLKDLEGKLSSEDIEKIKNWPKNKKKELIEFVKAKYDELKPSEGSSIVKGAAGLASGVVGIAKAGLSKITGGGGGLFGKNKSLEIQMQTLAETRAIRMMLAQKFEPVDVSSLLSEIRSSSEKTGGSGGIGKALGVIAKGTGGIVKGALGLGGKIVGGAAGLLGKGIGGILGLVPKTFGLAGKGLAKLREKGGDLKEYLEEKQIGDKLKATGSNIKNTLVDKVELAKGKALDVKEKIVNGAKNNKTNERGQVEGSYEDQIADNKEEAAEKREEENSNVLKAIAGALGVRQFRAHAGNSPTAIEKLEEIDSNGEDTNKALGKLKGSGGNGGGIKDKLKSLGTTAGAAAIGVGAAAAVGAGVAVAATGVKRTIGKFADTFKHTKGGGIGQKLNSLIGGSEAKYNDDGTEKTDQEKKNSRAKVNVGSALGLGKFMKLIEKLIKTALTNPKIAKLFGKAAGDGLINGIIKMLSKGLTKGAGKVAGKIASFCAKMSNPIGWGLTVAQAVAALVNGWTSTKRYFSLGKGIEPTIPMRITSALVSLLSDFVFGLIPVPEMVNFIFNLTTSDETKRGMEDGRAFVAKRAKVLGVDEKRLTEFESRTITERIFGSAQKWSNVLGFSKGNKNKDGVELFKRWRDEKYKPLIDMMDEMVKLFGKKVLKAAANEEDARHQKKFREEYLKKAEAYIKEHNLEWLVAGCKAEDEFAKSKEDEKTTITEGEIEEGNEATAEESKAVATQQTQATAALEASVPVPPKDEIPKSEATATGTATAAGASTTSAIPTEKPKSLELGKDTPVVSTIIEKPKITAEESKAVATQQADRWHGLNVGPMQDLSSKVLKPKKRKSLAKAVISKVVNSARQNIQRAIDLGATVKEKAAKMLSNTVFGRMASGAKNAIAGGAAKVASYFKKSGEKLLSKITNFKSGLEYITANRVEVQNQLKEAIANGDTQGIIDLIKRVKNKDMVGQQTTTEGLNPVMKERVEAFLNDPRVVGHGVRIRESIRPITSQIAYFLKGRAPNEVTDAAMKEAGFKYGINFWGKNFQNMGDTVTTTIGSNHFNGTAVDLEPGDIGYEKLGEIAKDYGLEWGGSWQGFKDPPHFELDNNWHGTLPVNDDTAVGTVKGNYQADSEGTSFDLAAKAEIPKSTTSGYTIDRASGLMTSLTRYSKASPVSAVRKILDNVTNRIAINGTSADIGNSGGIAQLVSIANQTDRKLDRGLAILEAIAAEQKRHDKINEEQMKNVLAGLSVIGKILTAGLSNIGNSGASLASIGNGANLTDGIFDRLARGD